MTAAVVVEDLHRSFGGVTALDGVDLEIGAGRVLALLGPNGAGKTTLVRICSTLLRPDRGRVVVAGADVVADPQRVRHSLGLSGQYAATDDRLTARENLVLVARLYRMSRTAARRRADELLARVRLTDVADRVVGTFSGGMRRRLDLAGALVAAPAVVVLDEPTTGLDPQSRLDIWEAVADLVAGGTTVLLTTQYLDEADRLAEHVTVIDHGRVVATGTADELKATVGGDRLAVVSGRSADLPEIRRLVAAVSDAEPVVDVRACRVEAPVRDGRWALGEVIDGLGSIPVRELGVHRPTLDDVFLRLTTSTAPAVATPEVTP